MSGRFAHNTGVLTNGDPAEVQAFDQDATAQKYLHDAGYLTAMDGKFFNTWPVSQDPPNWDRWALFGGGYWDAVFNVNGSVSHSTGYSTDVVADHAVEFLQDFESQDDTPWFLYLAPQAPHSPFDVDLRYQDAPVPPWHPRPSFGEKDISDKPPSVQFRSYSRPQARRLRAGQLRTLMSVDDMVQRVFDELEATGEASNTLAIFTSDNGYLWGEHRIGAEKRFPYLESVQVPFFLRWPGHVEPGSRDPRLAESIDILPTLLSAAGVTSGLKYPLDGRSLLTPGGREHALLEYWASPDAPGIGTWAATLTSRFEYIEWYGVDVKRVTFREYYDLVDDPFQLVNLLHDGKPANDPHVGNIARHLKRDRTCVGSICP